MDFCKNDAQVWWGTMVLGGGSPGRYIYRNWHTHARIKYIFRGDNITQLMSCVHGSNSRFENKDSRCPNPTVRQKLKLGQLNTTHQLSNVMAI